MQSRTLARELALLMLGQVSDRGSGAVAPSGSFDLLLQQAVTSLSQHVREALDRSAEDLQQAQQRLLDSELQDQGEKQLPTVRRHLQEGLTHAEHALNRLSASLELPRLLLLADQGAVQRDALGHSALLGITLGLLLGIDPTLVLIPFAVLFALMTNQLVQG
ncbi:metal ABC transporter permease, partial [Synechococcus sp. BA-120 BA3]|nr:metal ABC transporter permease [Synechococcus sp. BA-120 BA3]